LLEGLNVRLEEQDRPPCYFTKIPAPRQGIYRKIYNLTVNGREDSWFWLD